MKKVFVTGATGTMGLSALREFRRRGDDVCIVALARRSKRNRELLAEFSDMPGFSILWGDLLDYSSLLPGVRDADYVLHLGGMVSPAADYNPQQTLRVNVLGTLMLLKAIKECRGDEKTHFVYIGSIAQSGDNPAPRQWIFTHDLLRPSVGDAYALSKILAEKAVTESGLRHWVSLRQTGILAPQIVNKGSDPITFHFPLNACLEWTTDEASARALAAICNGEGGEQLWNRFHTIGGGNGFRLTSYEFQKILLDAMSCPPPEKIFDTRWFATRNFHSGWWGDSDRLERLLHYRGNETISDYIGKMKRKLPFYFRLAGIVPAPLIKAGMKLVASKAPLGTRYWLRHNDSLHIARHFGSREEADLIPGWKEVIEMLEKIYPPPGEREAPEPDKDMVCRDISRHDSEISTDDLQKKAVSLGGTLLSDDFKTGRLDSILEWRCGNNHSFRASAAAVMLGGHWCPRCLLERCAVRLPEDVATQFDF